MLDAMAQDGMIYTNMNKQILLLAMAIILVMGLASAIQELPPVKKGDCINLPQNCVTCTYNNITSIYTQGNLTYLLSGEYAMTRSGSTYNYTFCNTNTYGTYIVEGHGDISGVDTSWGGYSFEVNGSGQTVTQQQITLFIITLIVLLIFAIFWFVTSILFKHPGVKIFLMALCVATLVLIIGIISANASLYLAEFSNLANLYERYYILILTLAGAGLLGIIVWFIYYSVSLFNKTRGRSPEDD
jgi:hypothetical protein